MDTIVLITANDKNAIEGNTSKLFLKQRNAECRKLKFRIGFDLFSSSFFFFPPKLTGEN